jgi:glycosyltransferase involved in cell wall biosynthesis
MISICVPVYNGKEFVEECINSILKQTYKNFELIISNDSSTDNTLEIIQKYLDDDRVKIISNSKNIGWVKNCNLLISKTKYDYYCIIPHDDYIPENYIELLYQEIIKDNDISNCYPYICTIGKIKKKIYQNSILENSIELRIKNFILNHFYGVSFRGLVRKSKNPELLYLNEYLKNNIWADTYQILQHAIIGKLIQVNVQYYKRYHKNNTHSKWKTNNDDILNFYFSVYMGSKKYFSTDSICAEIINNKLSKHKININNRINDKKSFDFIVMGGGIQGCCTALYLKKRGFKVCIIEKNSSLMSGASGNHEGKIHLGFVYSNDKTFGTGKKMLIDSLNFSSSIEYLLDKKIDWNEIKSNKFIYLVPKTTLVKEPELDIFFEKIQNLYTKMLDENPELNYLGNRPKILYNKIEIPENFNREYFDCCYQTEEYSINHTLLNEKISNAIIENGIEVVLENYISCVIENCNYFQIITDKNIYYSSKVVNCLWENKTKIDNYILDEKYYDTNYRYKFGIISKKINELNNEYSITFVNGPYGDFVNFSNYMYFTWYPYSIKGFCHSDEPPKDWNIDKLIIDKENFISSHTDIFNYIFGKKFNFLEPKIIGGIIVATGDKDITEHDSKLHERNDIRIKCKNNYFTISTGKYTSAPYNSLLLKNFI